MIDCRPSGEVLLEWVDVSGALVDRYTFPFLPSLLLPLINPPPSLNPTFPVMCISPRPPTRPPDRSGGLLYCVVHRIILLLKVIFFRGYPDIVLFVGEYNLKENFSTAQSVNKHVLWNSFRLVFYNLLEIEQTSTRTLYVPRATVNWLDVMNLSSESMSELTIPYKLSTYFERLCTTLTELLFFSVSAEIDKKV